MSTGMPLGKHFSELRSRLIRIVITVIIITVFLMTVGFNEYNINQVNKDAEESINNKFIIYYPKPDPFNNTATQIALFMSNTLLPKEVKLIQTAPGQAFFAQINIAILIAIIASIPVIVKETFGFISPAIINKEKRIKQIVKISIPATGLLIVGMIFSYVLVIPFVLDFLYKYGESIGVATFLNINDFISFVLQFLLGFGISFELPVIMYIVSLTDLVDYNFWRKNFRYALLVFVILGAIITPDGSGITMWFITGPMIGLYMVGMMFIKRKEKKILKVKS
ncbi:MAG: twin-arginine translocase subunit TatC [Nitrososphaeraceae archaeon]|nr:twin-arginine translocase subunit TatC [Nitrososphaeraceae archaeon]